MCLHTFPNPPALHPTPGATSQEPVRFEVLLRLFLYRLSLDGLPQLHEGLFLVR